MNSLQERKRNERIRELMDKKKQNMKIEEWQKGKDTKVPIKERSVLHDIWLQEIHEEIKRKIESEKNTGSTETEIVGFIDIN